MGLTGSKGGEASARRLFPDVDAFYFGLQGFWLACDPGDEPRQLLGPLPDDLEGLTLGEMIDHITAVAGP